MTEATAKYGRRTKRRGRPAIPVHTYDYRNLMDRMGGFQAVHAEIIKRGWGAPNRRTVYRWHLRNSIPTPWCPYIFALGVELGAIKDMSEELPEQEGALL